ncbi:MAG: 1-acyl-sn-glycerol-3-phosphate acyltransferase [Candidatus Cryptobacteroides sp.]
MQETDIRIDIGSILQKRSVNLPGFLVKWLEKFIHQDFLNEFMTRGYSGVEFCDKCLEYLGVKVEVNGIENLPRDRRCTLVCNHPLGGIDAVALCAVTGKKYDGKILVLANDFLMNIKGLAPLFVPVNKVGSQTADIRDRVSALFNSDSQVIIFPSGKVSRKYGGEIKDPEWKTTFMRWSIETGRDIVPVHFYGSNSKRFYNIDRIARFFNVKFPVGMAFLPDELYRSQGKTFRLVIGEPIPVTVFDKSRNIPEWTRFVRDRVYEL